jgi:hypothetical protein
MTQLTGGSCSEATFDIAPIWFVKKQFGISSFTSLAIEVHSVPSNRLTAFAFQSEDDVSASINHQSSRAVSRFLVCDADWRRARAAGGARARGPAVPAWLLLLTGIRRRPARGLPSSAPPRRAAYTQRTPFSRSSSSSDPSTHP